MIPLTPVVHSSETPSPLQPTHSLICRAAGDALAQRLDKRQLRYDMHRTLITAAYGAFAVGECGWLSWDGLLTPGASL